MRCANCNQPREKHDYDKFCPTNDANDVVEYLSGKLEGVDIYHPEYPKYLNVYRVEQCFGGPEEGGWWFDAGEPLESVQVDNKEQEDLLRFGFMDRYDLDIHNNYVPRDMDNPDRERMRGRTSAAGGYDICIRIEYGFAQPFPQKRPRYE